MKYCEQMIGITLDDRIQICAGALTIDGLNFCFSAYLNDSAHITLMQFYNLDACRGDSGGPFMQIANTKFGPKYFLTGILVYLL